MRTNRPAAHRAGTTQTAAANLHVDAGEVVQQVAGAVRQWQTAGPAKQAAAVSRFLATQGHAAAASSLSTTTPFGALKDAATPVFWQGQDLLPEAKAASSLKELVYQFNKAKRAALGFTAIDDRLEVLSSHKDNLGMTHVRLQQVYAHVPVYGRDIYLHLNNENQLVAVNGRLSPISAAVDTKPALTANAAIERARQALGTLQGRDKDTASLTIYYDAADTPHLAFLVSASPALDKRYELFIDAHSGEVLHQANRICFDGRVNASGTDLSGVTRPFSAWQIGADNYMIDASKQMFDAGRSSFLDKTVGTINVYDAANGNGEKLYYNQTTVPTSWANANAVSAVFWGNAVYDYYLNVHGRNSIDAAGGTIFMAVNYETDYNNAFWNGQFMIFGNGDGSSFSDLAGALDVTGHEMTHGVIEHTANLIYENQSGALNESFADVFGTAVEFYKNGADANWLMGEDVTTPTISGDALRDMQNPASGKVAFSKQPTTMSEYRNLSNDEDGDYGGVHTNSGIPNRAFYLVVQAIGMQKAEKIYYRTLANYLTRSAQFIDLRLALEKAAADIYGRGSAEQIAIQNAMDQVGITDGQGTPPPPTEDPVIGDDWVLAVDSGNNLLYRISADGQTIEQIAGAAVMSKPSVSDDGSFVLFIDQDNNPWIAATDGSYEEQLDDSGIFWNLSISPDGNKLAAVTNDFDGLFYFIDMNNDANSSTYQLYSQTYSEGVQSGFVAYADAMDWTLDSEWVVYDALNETTTASGDSLEYWDINFIRMSDGTIIRAFPPQPEGIDVGNPVLASNNDFLMAFDYMDESGNVSIYAVNLETGDVGLVADNGQAVGRPDFSPDDRAMIYQYTDGFTDAVYWRPLADDGITGTGEESQFLTGAIFPIWMTIGMRSDIAQQEAAAPTAFRLEQNYPNPFNPQTRISFELPTSARASLEIVDVLGRTVKMLQNSDMAAGRHNVVWDATDELGRSVSAGLYFYRLQAGDFVAVKKMLLVK